MQSNTTFKQVRRLCTRLWLTLLVFSVGLGTTLAQPYINGNLSTGPVSQSGLTAPTGYTWSEVQAGNGSAGFNASIASNFTVADDFTIPAGQSWNISDIRFYAYSTGYAGATSPFDVVRLQIFNVDPSTGTPTPVFGDLTTNRFGGSADALMYRIFNNAGPTPDPLTRKIWEVTANVNTTLTAGTYWIEWQLGTITGVTSNFSPASTVVGTTTQAGNNGLQHNLATSAWTPLNDGTNRQDMPFRVNYSTGCTGTPPTITVSPVTGGCSPVTLTASGAVDYTWSPAAGLNTTNGNTVIATPAANTTYTVIGVDANGCSNTATVTVNASPTAAVLSGIPPTVTQLDENFDAGIPATWALVNNSNPVGTVATWGQGSSTVFPAFNGAPDAFAFANFNSVAASGDVISNWLITPQITTINNGDKLAFYTRTTDASAFPDRLEVRLSTAGASTNVGATDLSVGDFTTLLISINPNLDPTPAYPDAWTRFEVTISGLAATATGRIGFRYFVEDAGPNGNNSDYIGLDAVTYSTPSACGVAGDLHNLSVAVTGGAGPYTVVYTDGTSNFTVNGYTSTNNIPVTPSATTTYSLVSVADANNCSTTNLSGSYTAVLAPVLLTPPANSEICIGGSVTLTANVAGQNLTYQWQISTDGGTTWNDVVNGADYNGATTEALTISNGSGTMAGHQFRVVYGNATCGTQTSPVATLTIGTSATITTQPVDVTICSGNNAAFSIVTSGGGNIQWQVSTDGGATWNDLAGETNANLALTNVAVSQNGNQFRAVLSSCGFPVNSTAVTLTVNESAVITAQPSSVTGCAGDNVSFTTTTSGPNVTYQWQISTDGGATWGDITGETSSSLTINAIDATLNGNQYRVVVNNPCTVNLNSDAATLTVSSIATITTQPADVTVCDGQDASFTVNVTGGSTYQWQESSDGGTTWTDITGATGATLNLTAVTNGDNGNQYRAIVASCPTALTSDAATLTVNDLATFTTQPADVNVCSGNDATFTVATAGNGVSVQWQVSTDGGATWTDITGATGNAYTITGVTNALNANQYRAVISNTCTLSLNSSAATLSVGSTASITTQPASTSVCAGQDASFTIAVTGATSLQWQESTDGGTTWTDIPGATNATYTITGTTTAITGNSYQVVVGSCPTPITSDVATLTVNATVSISAQPAAASGCDGSDASFSVTAANATGYQWQVSTDGGTTWTDIAGATNSTLDINGMVLSQNNNQYRVIVSNGCGNVTSGSATLTVNELPTVTANGPNTACAGASITLTGDGANTYSWDNGVTNNTAFNINNTTTYTVTGTDANGCENSASITVTVTPLPVVTISASVTEIPAGGTSTLTATSNPAAASFIWRRNGTIVTGATGNTLIVTDSEAGDYTAEAVVGGCAGVSNVITLTVLPANFSFITPNPNNGNFQVRVRNTGNPVRKVREIMVFDRKGSRLYANTFISDGVNDIDVMDVQLQNVSNGTYFMTLYENGFVVKTAQVYVNK